MKKQVNKQDDYTSLDKYQVEQKQVLLLQMGKLRCPEVKWLKAPPPVLVPVVPKFSPLYYITRPGLVA